MRGPSSVRARHPTGLSRRRHSAARGLGYTRAAISSLHTRYALQHQRCTLSSGTSRIAGDRPVPHIVTELPGPQGAGPRRVRRDLDVAQPAARLPDRPGPGRRPDGRGHRRQPLPRLRGRHRGQLDRPLASAGRRGDQGAGRRADPLLARPTSTCRSTPRSAASSRGSRRSRAGPGPTSATPGPRSSRRRSSSPATRPSGRTSWPSWARSTAGPTARSR